MASDGGNADTYAYEEEQERKALLQSLHGPMKTWFHGGEASRLVKREVDKDLEGCSFCRCSTLYIRGCFCEEHGTGGSRNLGRGM